MVRVVLIRAQPPGDMLGSLIMEFGQFEEPPLKAAIRYASEDFHAGFSARGAADPDAALADIHILGSAPGRGITRDQIDQALRQELAGMVGEDLADQVCTWLLESERVPPVLLGDHPAPESFRINMPERLYQALSEALHQWAAQNYANPS